MKSPGSRVTTIDFWPLPQPISLSNRNSSPINLLHHSHFDLILSRTTFLHSHFHTHLYRQFSHVLELSTFQGCLAAIVEARAILQSWATSDGFDTRVSTSVILCEIPCHQAEPGVGRVSPKISLDLCQLISCTLQAPLPVAGILGLEEEEGVFVLIFVFELHLAPAFSLPRETNQFWPVITSQPSRGILEPKRNQCFCPMIAVINSSILDSSVAMILINH